MEFLLLHPYYFELIELFDNWWKMPQFAGEQNVAGRSGRIGASVEDGSERRSAEGRIEH